MVVNVALDACAVGGLIGCVDDDLLELAFKLKDCGSVSSEFVPSPRRRVAVDCCKQGLVSSGDVSVQGTSGRCGVQRSV